MNLLSSSTVMLIVILADQTTAFVPNAPVRIVGGSIGGSLVTTPMPVATMTTTTSGRASSTSSSALQMNLFDRFFRVAKSNFNLIVSNLEEPEKILDQAVIDMQNDMTKIRQTYAEVAGAQRRLQQQKDQHSNAAEEWYQRAQLALQRGKEDLTRQALTRRQVALEEAASVQQQLDSNGVALDKLYQSLQVLDQKILDARSKKDQMVARARTAKTTMQVNDMLSGVTGKTSMDAFKRMEQKVEALEAAAEASAEMTSLSASFPEASLEREFLQLEAMDSVEQELKQLKEMVQEDKTRYPKALQPSNPTKAMGDRVERELQTMKQSTIRKIPVEWQ